jgi:hypothetical protein
MMKYLISAIRIRVWCLSYVFVVYITRVDDCDFYFLIPCSYKCDMSCFVCHFFQLSLFQSLIMTDYNDIFQPGPSSSRGQKAPTDADIEAQLARLANL